MFLLSADKIDRIVSNRRRYFFAGLLVMAPSFFLPKGWGIGLFSGFQLFSLGIYAFCLRKWRSDPGLWMLAGLLTVTLGPGWLYFEFLHYQSLFVAHPGFPVPPPTLWDRFRFSVDGMVALTLFSKVVRLATSVAIENWRRTKTISNTLTPNADRKTHDVQ